MNPLPWSELTSDSPDGLDFDLEHLLVGGPLWHAGDAEGGIGLGGTTGGRPYVPVFTRRDLAERWTARSGIPRLVPIELPTPAGFLAFLASLAGGAHGRVAVDPEPHRPTRSHSISEVIAALRRGTDRAVAGLAAEETEPVIVHREGPA
jgi:hypothetical protein